MFLYLKKVKRQIIDNNKIRVQREEKKKEEDF